MVAVHFLERGRCDREALKFSAAQLAVAVGVGPLERLGQLQRGVRTSADGTIRDALATPPAPIAAVGCTAGAAMKLRFPLLPMALLGISTVPSSAGVSGAAGAGAVAFTGSAGAVALATTECRPEMARSKAGPLRWAGQRRVLAPGWLWAPAAPALAPPNG